MNPTDRIFPRDDRPGDDNPPPVGNLVTKVHDPDFKAAIKDAEIICGFHPATREQVGLFYGVAQLRRIITKGADETAEVFNVPVDPETDDLEVLVAMVQAIKGTCCYQDLVL